MRLIAHCSLRTAVVVLVLACSHSDVFPTAPIAIAGPVSTGADVQLTFNVDQNYWPAWTEDGRGILYAYVDLDAAPSFSHRCLGLLPAAGGTRIWQLCDNRAVRTDTLGSYSAFALDSSGRLLLAEAVAPAHSVVATLPRTTLWLTDTARPYVRTALLTLPQSVTGFTITWLADIQWTGPRTFLALAQQFNAFSHCQDCACNPCPVDTVLADGGMVVAGTIAGNVATLLAVGGTDSATSYSLAENGASIVFTRHHDLRLFKVPVTGGTSIPLPVHRDVPDTADLVVGELAGVSCRRSTCVYARDRIFLADGYSNPFGSFCPSPVCEVFAHFLPGNGFMELHRVSLASGLDEVIQSGATRVFATPQLSPVSGDLVVQLGGIWGHLQTYATAGRGNGELHLLKAIVP